MFIHSQNGQVFVGLRSRACGRRQVVVDSAAGKRVVLDIKSPFGKDDLIEAALREGIETRNVFAGVKAALRQRKILVETWGVEDQEVV